MTAEPLLHRLRETLSPADGAQARVERMIRAKMPQKADLSMLDTALAPLEGAKERVWARIAMAMTHSPRDSWNLRFVKWTAAVAVFGLIVQGLPTLFLAPRTVAESQVVIMPTKGEVFIDGGGLSQPIAKETVLRAAATFETGDGEATFVLNDDGNLRMGTDTKGTLHDIINRPESTTAESTISVSEGSAWVQAFVPFHLRPIVIRTPQAFVTMHEGSASVHVEGGVTTIKVWDRHATVQFGDSELILVAGEQTAITADTTPAVARLDDAEYDDGWVAQNLERDAVHRREIAQGQLERSIAQAGILPTSRFLYPVKRAVEEMDVLLTFDSQARIEKRLDQATARLNEATALIAEGNTDAAVPLEEFRSTMIEIAAGSGGDLVTDSLIRHRVEESTAQLAALKADDEGYAVKVAVLEASAELPLDVVEPEEVQAVLLADAVDTAAEAADAGDKERAAELLEQIEPQIASAQSDELPTEMLKDVNSALDRLTAVLEEPAEEDIEEEPTEESTETVVTPPKRPTPAERPPREEQVRRLSSGELAELIAAIVLRVSNVSEPQSQWNELQLGIRQAREDYPSDFGMILRHLHMAFKDNSELDAAILAHIQALREEQ